jgi:hypothetical protein
MRRKGALVGVGMALLGFAGCRGILDIEDGTLLEPGSGGASSSGASGMHAKAGGGGGLGGMSQSQGGRNPGEGGTNEAGSGQGGNEPAAQGGTAGITANGGTSGDAGSSSDGGTVGKGGTDNRGGATPGSGGTSGGAPSTGGVTNKGGASSRGGASSSGGAPSNGGTTSKGGTTGAGGTTTSGGSGTGGAPVGFDVRTKTGKGESSNVFFEADVSRNGVNYYFIANGWGSTLQSQTVNYDGTGFSVKSLSATAGSTPVSFPAMFCGNYSGNSSGACGLPKTISTITSLMTGWRWSPSATGVYNAAYDIWLSNNGSVSGYVMVWLFDSPSKQPIGSLVGNATINGAQWNVWKGSVSSIPCVSYTRPTEGVGLYEYEFDAMLFVKNAQQLQAVPGNQVAAVAVGFEIWSGPITNLTTQDFYVEVK